MLFAQFTRNRFRFIVVCLSVMGAAGITIASGKKKDNLYPVIEALEKKADEVLSDPDHRQGSLLNALSEVKDRTTPASETFLLVLLDRLQKTKEAIETEAAKRATLSIGNDRVQVLSEVSARYLFQQRRILLNRFRAAHALTGSESRFNANDYDRYNLILPNNAGLLIAQNRQYGLKLNVWHVSRAGQYDHVELGLNPQDKNEAEEAVLRETVSEDRYAKLVQLMSIRERTVNHWSIQRISKSGVLSDPNLNSCGPNLVSFARGQISQKIGYYDFLSKYDEYEAFLKKLKNGLSTSTFDLPILTKEESAIAYRQFFYSLPEYETAKTMVDAAKLQDYLDRQVAEFSGTKIEGFWKERASGSLLMANYPADRWSAADVADRISWVAWDLRKTALIEQMTQEAQSQGVDAMAKDKRQVRELAEKAASPYLNLQRETLWRNEVKKRVAAYLGSVDLQKADLQIREDRFQSLFDHTWPGMKSGSEAIFVKNEAKAVTTANLKRFWDQDIRKKAGYSDSDSDLQRYGEMYKKYSSSPSVQAFMPASGLMKRRIYPWTPDQLSQFFYKKLAFMIEQKEFRKLSQHAEKIAKNGIVMKGIEKMFGKISEAYMNRLKAARVNPAQVPADSPYLYLDLRSVIQESFAEFNQAIHAPPPATRVAATPAPKNTRGDLKQGAVAAVDQTRVQRALPIVMKSQSEFVSEDAKELFINAVALIGLSHSALNRVPSTRPSDRFETATFAQLEAMLKLERMTPDSQLKNEMIRSIYDQSLIADVIYGQMLSQYPILTLQFENKLKAPALLDIAAKKGLSKGEVDQALGMSVLREGVAVAAKNQGPLVSEACRAQPFVKYNEEWRNVFGTAGTLRKLLQGANSSYKPLDEKITKLTRTWWETQLEDVIDPVAQFFFYASLIAMAVMFTPMVIGGISGLTTLGSWTVGAAGAMQSLGLSALMSTEASGAFASVALAIGKQVLKTVVGKFVMWIFTAQIAVMGYVNCYELPAHLKYQLGVANSQIGIFAESVTDRNELKQLADVIFAKEVSTVFMGALQIAFIAKPTIVWTKNVLGLSTEQALARSAAYEGNEVLINGLKQKTFSQLIDEHGMWSGTQKWMSQTTESLAKYGRISTLTPEVMQSDLEKIMTTKMQKLFPTIESYEELVKERLYAMNESRRFLLKQIKQLREQNPSSKTQFTNWMKNKMMKHIAGGNYWNVAVSDRAKTWIVEDLTQTGANRLRQVTENEIREFAIRAYEEDLFQAQTYWGHKLGVLKIFKDELAPETASAMKLIGKDGRVLSEDVNQKIMKEFLGTFGTQDIAQHHELLNWTLSKTSSNVVTAKFKDWFGSSPEVQEFKQIFKDHQILMDELNRMKPKPKANPQADAAEPTEAAEEAPPKTDWSKVKAETLVIIDVDPKTGEMIWGAKPKSEAPKASRKSFKLFMNKFGFNGELR